MKKIFAFIAVLALLAGTAYAADLNAGLTKQVWGQTKGRSVVSDGSVIMRVWYIGSASGTVDISPNSVNLYDNGVLTSVSYLTYGNVQSAVDYINSLATWKAAVGPDSRPGQYFATSKTYLSTANTSAGTSKTNPTNVYMDSSYARQLSAGVEATDGVYNRIKSVTYKYATTNPGTVTLLIYDGDNLAWRKDTNTTPYNTAADKNASPDTITFVNYTDKGIAGGYGKSLVAVVSSDTAIIKSSPVTTDGLTDHNISIVYDQF